MPRPCRRSRTDLRLLSLPALACCLLLGLIVARSTGEAQTTSPPRVPGLSRVTIVLHGLRDRSGYLRVSLYDRPGGFPGGPPTARRDIPLPALDPATPLDALTIAFAGLPSGAYAVCAFHDRDGSGRLAQNSLGIPQEEWAMSGNPRPRFRAPRFQEAAFPLKPAQDKVVVLMLRR